MKGSRRAKVRRANRREGDELLQRMQEDLDEKRVLEALNQPKPDEPIQGFRPPLKERM